MKKAYLFVCPWSISIPGGVSQVIQNLHRECAREGTYRPLLLVQNWRHPRPVPGAEAGLPGSFEARLRPPVIRGQPLLRSLAAFLLAGWREWRGLRSFLREQNVDVINIHFPGMSEFGILMLKRMGLIHCRVILTLHGSEVRGFRNSSGLEYRLFQWMLGAADTLIAVSHHLAASARSVFPDLERPIRVVHNGVSPESLPAEVPSLPALPSLRDGRRFMLTIGTFERQKGQDVLIRAFAAIADRVPDWDLVLVGRTSDCLEPLLAQVAAAGLERRIFLVRDLPHEQIGGLLSRAGLFALPSRRESFGLVLLEAACFDLPVVASRVDGIPEIIGSRDVGLLVEPDDAEALAAALLRVAGDEALRRDLGKALGAHVRRTFSWGATYRKYLETAVPA